MTEESSIFDIASLDWGAVRFGLAFGNTKTGIIIPYNIECPTLNIFNILAGELGKRNIKSLVIGIPTNFQGQHTIVTQQILVFISRLKTNIPDLEIKTINERNTSLQAKSTSLKKLDKTTINHLAAQKILEHFLNSKH